MQHICHYNVIFDGLHIETHKIAWQPLIHECTLIILAVLVSDHQTKCAALEFIPGITLDFDDVDRCCNVWSCCTAENG